MSIKLFKLLLKKLKSLFQKVNISSIALKEKIISSAISSKSLLKFQVLNMLEYCIMITYLKKPTFSNGRCSLKDKDVSTGKMIKKTARSRDARMDTIGSH